MKKKNEFNYFDEFAKLSRLALQEVEELKRFILKFNKFKSKEEMKKIHEIENKADVNLHEIKNYLFKDFLPPIDREDILYISNKLDDFVDGIDEIAIDIDIYDINEITTNMKKLMELLEKSAKKLYDLVLEFKNFKKVKEIKEKVIEINKIEEEADRLYEESIRQLYQNEKDAIKVIIWSNIYSTIEGCFDACEDIADSIDDTLLKNS